MQATGQISAQAAQQALNPQPELGRLKAAAQRISEASWRVQTFLNNFHGPMPEASIAGTDAQDCYRNDIESVFSALDTLEARVSMLEHIG